MGYHVVGPQEPGNPRDVPVIQKDGGTGSWRDAKKVVRKWYLDQAHQLRQVSEKGYFEQTSDSDS